MAKRMIVIHLARTASETAEESLLMEFVRATHKFREAKKAIADRIGMQGTPARQCVVLTCLLAHPGISQARLAKLTGTDDSTLNTMVRELGGRGQKLLTAKKDPASPKFSILTLTSSGEFAARRIVRLVGAFQSNQ
ncbi:MAG: winged helix-turn-helix transcriptional regulator [bacterium]